MVNGVLKKGEMCEKSLNFLLKKGYKPWKILTWNQINFDLRAVTKILHFWVYPISRRGIEQPGSPSGFIFPLFPVKVAQDYAHSCQEKCLAAALSDSQAVTCNVYDVVVFFFYFSANFYFFFCFNFLSIHYHAQQQKNKQKLPKIKKITTTYTIIWFSTNTGHKLKYSGYEWHRTR